MHRLVDRTLGGNSPLAGNLVRIEQLGQRHPENGSLERRYAIERPPGGVGRYQLIKLGLAMLHEPGKRTRELVRIAR
jgi:hypothetical protein